MFDVNESIEEGYLWNFSLREQKAFLREHRNRQNDIRHFSGKLFELMAADSPAIFANYDPYPSSPLEIKYTFNRIYMNDPREKELTLNRDDPPAPENRPYAKKIVWAFEFNTFCRTVALNGVQTREGWHKRGFNDQEADHILDALSDKKLDEFSFTSYPLLTDVTYLKIANILMRPNNQWKHVTLGRIPVASDIANIYDRTGKVSYTRIVRQRANQSLSSRLFKGIRNERS